MKRSSKANHNIGVRLSPEIIERIDALAKSMSEGVMYIDVNRSDAARAAILAGLEKLEQQYGKGRAK